MYKKIYIYIYRYIDVQTMYKQKEMQDRHHEKARTENWLKKCMEERDLLVGVGISDRSSNLSVI